MTVIFIAMSWYVVKFHALSWGIGGLAMATTIAATLHMIVMYYFLSKRTHGLQGFKTLAMLIKLGIATVVLSAGTIGVKALIERHLASPGIAGYALLVLLPSLVGGLLFLCAAIGMRMDEIQSVGSMLARFTGRKRAA
jgi:peptidoglycan biosynthesis protein MviN/MurJ (putative lipid II flippase)